MNIIIILVAVIWLVAALLVARFVRFGVRRAYLNPHHPPNLSEDEKRILYINSHYVCACGYHVKNKDRQKHEKTCHEFDRRRRAKGIF
jgi:hypothetical protein